MISPLSASNRNNPQTAEWKGKKRAKLPYRILLVDGSETFLSGLVQAIHKKDKDIVIQVACTAGEVQANDFDWRADVAVIDVDLADQSGFDLCLWLNREMPNLSVFLLSQQDWDVILAASWKVKARGVLIRSDPMDRLVQDLFHGFISPDFSAAQQERAQQWIESVGTKLGSLGRREWQVLGLLAGGMNNHEVAAHLQVTENTVDKHIGSLLRKLDLNSRASLVSFYFTQHLNVLERVHDVTSLFV